MEQGLMQYTLYHETPKGSDVKRYKLTWMPLADIGKPITQKLDLDVYLNDISSNKKPSWEDWVESEMEFEKEIREKERPEIFPVGNTLEELAYNARANEDFNRMYQGEQFITYEGRIHLFSEIDVFEAIGDPVSQEELVEFQRMFSN